MARVHEWMERAPCRPTFHDEGTHVTARITDTGSVELVSCAIEAKYVPQFIAWLREWYEEAP